MANRALPEAVHLPFEKNDWTNGRGIETLARRPSWRQPFQRQTILRVGLSRTKTMGAAISLVLPNVAAFS